MPVLYWVFSASFLIGAARLILVGLGFGIVSFIASNGIIYALEQLMYNGAGGWIGPLGFFLEQSGINRCFGWIVAAFTFRMASAFVKRFRLL